MDSETRRLNRKIHALAGGVVFLISFIVYSRSVAPTTSFWDCGEFIACSYILGVMHPPGAPLYLLIGRILTMNPIFGDIGLRVNMFSIFISAATVLLTFLIIVQLIQRWRGEAKNWEDRLIIFTSAAFGALAFAFTDSFWFNAVEAEVYAFSMFFTALVVWLALYWGERSEKAASMLIIFFIFYMFGLAIGVHLLNILAFPFVLLIAFFHDNLTVKRLLVLLTIQAVVPITLYTLFYQFNPENMSYTQILNHQAKAGNFMKWFGLFWVGGSLIYIYRKDRKVFKAWWIVPLLVLLGYSLYLVIYIRAGLAPPINENDPSTLQGMKDYLARKQYGTEDLLLTFMYRKAEFWQYQIHKMYTRYFGWQFIGKGTTLDYHDRIVEIISFKGLYGLPFIVGLWGAVHHFFRDRKRALSVLVLFILTGYAIIIYLNQPDPQPRERDYSYVGSFFAFALWIGIGMAGIFEWISDALHNKIILKKIVYTIAGVLLFIAVPWNLYACNHRSHSRAGNYVAYDYSYNILQSCEQNGIIFTNGDNDTFPLWFLQEVFGIRKDVRVVNLSLLNTHWYIKQLRDQEPKIPLNLSDKTIENLYPIAWKTQKVEIPIPKDVYEELKEQSGNEELPKSLIFSLEPTFKVSGSEGLKVQDLMVIRILQACKWKRPVYFAVTVSNDNKIGLDKYLRMDGLAFKVVPYKVKDIEPEILKTNLLEKYIYRGLDDSKVYFNINIVKLLQNYRSAFLSLARYYLENGQKDESSFILDEMSRRIPEKNIPYSDERGALLVSDMYQRAGRSSEVGKRVDNVIQGRHLGRQDQIWLAGYYSQVLQDWDRAEEIFRRLVNENPDDVEAYSGLFQTYKWSKQYEKGIELLENWLMRHPRDPNAKKELQELKNLAAVDTAIDESSDNIP